MFDFFFGDRTWIVAIVVAIVVGIYKVTELYLASGC